MAVKVWACDPQTGNVLGQMPIADGARFVSRLGGGIFNAQVPLGQFRTRDGSSPDLGAIRRFLDWCDGGRHTLLVTDGTEVIGEWLTWKHGQPSDGGLLPISGIEWDAYPQFRSLFTRFQYTNADLGTVVRDLLAGAIFEYQSETMGFTIPAITTGIRVTIDHKSRTKYFGDVLDDLSRLDPGMEWRVKIGAEWDGDVPTRAVRTVIYGVPEIRTPTSIRLVKPPTGRRHGNVISWERSRDYSKAAQSMYGWGGGEGDKQRFIGLSDPTGWRAGGLAITKNISFPGELSDALLEKKTRKALADAQNTWEPTSASVDAQKLPTRPLVGDVLACDVGWSYTYPDGFKDSLRVGEVTTRTGSPLIDLELA